MTETWVRSQGWEDPLEKGKVTHSSILAWRIPRTEELGRLQSTGSQRVRHDWATSQNHGSDCSHEIKRHLLLGRKTMTNLDSILKSKDITLLTNIYIVKAMVFPVVRYGCESWTIKKGEWRRIDVFELQGWRRLLKVPQTAKRSNQSILKEINPEYSLIGRTDTEAEAPIRWPPDVKSWYTGKDTDAGKNWGQEQKGTTEDEMVGWHHQLNGLVFEQTPGNSDGPGRPGGLQFKQS